MKVPGSTRTITPAPHTVPGSPRARAAAFLSAGGHDPADGIPVRMPFARDARAAASSADAVMAQVRALGAPDQVPPSLLLERRPARTLRLAGLAAAAVLVAALSSIVTFGIIRSGATVDVRFVLVAPEARSVWLAADFNEWSSDGYALQKASDGTWEITVPLRKGKAYSYNFVIDGERWVVDPSAPARLDDGFGGSSSSLTL